MDKILTLEQIQNMSIEEIARLYREGYRIEESSGYPGLYPDENKIIPYSPRGQFGFMSDPQIKTAQDGISISSGALLLIGIGVFAYFIYKKSP